MPTESLDPSPYDTISVDRFPIDCALVDSATLGPEAAHFAQVYLDTPRALVWRNPSSDWKLLVLLLPMASRLSMMSNPIFANLVRDWGMNVRFIGVDESHRVFDFRKLLTDQVLQKLVHALDHICDRGNPSAPRETKAQMDHTLDLLFSVLAKGMLTMLEKRRSDWPTHLAREHRLEPGIAGSLFDRDTRFPDFLRALQNALKQDVIDIEFYGRALRAMDLREETVERRISALIQSSLDVNSLQQLARCPVGLHLGCYNWLAIDPRHSSQRQYVLQRLACFAQFFSDSLLTREDITQHFDEDGSVWPQASDTSMSQRMAQAVDSGQDRQVIEAIAQRFAVSSNTVRNLWRVAPTALGTPATWHLQQILLRLDSIAPRAWPSKPNDWLSFKQLAAH